MHVVKLRLQVQVAEVDVVTARAGVRLIVTLDAVAHDRVVARSQHQARQAPSGTTGVRHTATGAVSHTRHWGQAHGQTDRQAGRQRGEGTLRLGAGQPGGASEASYSVLRHRLCGGPSHLMPPARSRVPPVRPTLRDNGVPPAPPHTLYLIPGFAKVLLHFLFLYFEGFTGLGQTFRRYQLKILLIRDMVS